MRIRHYQFTIRLVLLVTCLVFSQDSFAARLKELVDVQGFRSNRLVGVGIVVGLQGTGDDASSFLAKRPLATLMRNLGSNIDPSDVKAKNVAMVMVTAELPPFSRPGVPFDVIVSSIGTAKGLQGGTLVATALKGLDRQTYAMAQGQLTVGGYDISSTFGGTLNRKNHVTVARIPGGGQVEREVPQIMPKSEIALLLRQPDFTTASRIVQALNTALGAETANVKDPGSIAVKIDDKWKNTVVDLIATIEAIDVNPDGPARVVVDERTGTIVVGANVKLGSVAIAYGGIHIKVDERFLVSQPGAFSPGRTAIVPEAEVNVEEREGKLQVVPEAATVGDIAQALNALGVKPRDLVPIFQALKASGALRAEIFVM